MKHNILAAACAAAISGAAAPAIAVDLPPTAIRIAPSHATPGSLPMEAARAQRGAVRSKDSTPPAITGGDIVSKSLHVNVASAFPELNFAYTTGSAGLSAAGFTFTAPSGVQSITVLYLQGPLSTSGSVTFLNNSTIPAFAQPGKWALTGAFIQDYAGNFTQYTQAQIAALFSSSSIRMIDNGPIDFTPPKVINGKVLTPTVSESSPDPQFRVDLRAKDNGSGVAFGYVYILPPAGNFGQTNLANQPKIVSRGNLELVAGIFPGQPTGAWSITGYEACDLAGNCLIDQNPADVQTVFGTTTFNVTD